MVGALSRRIVAAHEGGHALAAWYSGSVERVHGVKILRSGGITAYRQHERVHVPTQDLWSNVVIGVAGIAGEFRRGGRVYAPGAASDLVLALRDAEAISRRCDPLVAFPVDTSGKTQVTRMLCAIPSEGARHTLEAAYLKARALLRSYDIEHQAIMRVLAFTDELSTRELGLLLGDRPRQVFALAPRGTRLRRRLRCLFWTVALCVRATFRELWAATKEIYFP